MPILILLSGVSLGVAEAEKEAEEIHRAASREEELLEEMGALWEKIGPDAKKGSKLAMDNRAMFDSSYRRLSKILDPGVEEKPGRAPRRPLAGLRTHQEIDALACLPTAYGWPMSRPLKKDIRYTALAPVGSTSEHEVLVEIYPAESKAKLVLEIDGEPVDQPVKANERVAVLLKRGVRALSVSTSEDVQLQFIRLRLEETAKE
ncbi:MAG: hypothetical protein HKN82_08250 [Akkermansiaceae bacterium]|nr:hypothetical protein [Akkermansiaceae bacterium]